MPAQIIVIYFNQDSFFQTSNNNARQTHTQTRLFVFYILKGLAQVKNLQKVGYFILAS